MTIKRDVTAGARQCAVQHFHQFGTSGPHQPGYAKDLAFTQRERNIVYARTAQVIDLQANITRRFFQARVLIFQLTSHHHFNQRVFCQRGNFTFGNKLPVTEDGYVVANLEDLFHTVRNIDNAASLGFQFADDAEQGFGFGIGEGIRRFIHNDDLRFKAQHFGNFDHLLIANRQLTDQPVAFKA